MSCQSHYTSVLQDYVFFFSSLSHDTTQETSYSFMRGSRSTVKLPMECKVNTLLPFVKKYALLRIAMPYF